MLPNAFIGKLKKPTNSELADALGPAKEIWDQLLAHLADDLEVNKLEWNSYSPKAGWALKVKKGSRTIFYMAPCDDAIRVAFILGDKAKQAALRSDLPAKFVKMIRQAKKYPEGTAVRIETKSAADLVVIYKLAIAKLEN